MSLERHLPENVARHLQQQLQAARDQISRYSVAIDHARNALREVQGIPMPLSAADAVTVTAVSTALKCLEADREATRRSELALTLKIAERKRG